MLSTLAVPAAAAHINGYGFGFGLLFLLIPLFIIGLIFLFGGLARRRWARDGFGPGHFGYAHHGAAQSAESTLAERFAQGDIDEKEYRARLEVLRANNDIAPTRK